MSDILDSLIGTGSVVLALSLIVQAFQQIIKQWLDLKSKYMVNELLALFGDPADKPKLRAGLLPVGSFDKKAGELAKVLAGQIENATRGLGFRDVHLVETMSKEEFIGILKTIPLAADKSLEAEFKKALVKANLWFNVAMRAFQEHYERRMKYWAFGLSAAVVLMLNMNLFDVYREFSHSKPLRDAAAAMGERLTSIQRDSIVIHSAGSAVDTSFVIAKPDSEIANEMRATVAGVRQMLDEESFQPMGWTKARLARYDSMKWYRAAPEMFLGWLAMTLLVSMGAPFWYDFLKTALGVKKWVAGKGESPSSPNKVEDTTST